MRVSLVTLALTTLAFADNRRRTDRLAYLEDSDDFRVSEEMEDVLLGAPRDYKNADFQLMSTCADSGATEHTMAQMTVDFTQSCATVSKEVQARASGADGWTDPHNEGNYSVLSADADNIKIKRRTGNNEYTDVITFALAAKGAGCTANVCSVSQGNSNNDAGTNLCNMENLYCNTMTKDYETGVGCKSLTNDLTYTTPYQECGRYKGNGQYREHDCQDFVDTCLKNEPLKTKAPQSVILGRPRDKRNDDFQLMSTCAASGATEHTMAQMTVDFTDKCSVVAAEVQARAQGTDGWTDPHNEGHYTLMETTSDSLKIKRRTGNNEYTDVLTFALTDTATGCTANACSVSQGNSNNDAGTNMCNMQDLFCNSSTENSNNGVACKAVKTDLTSDISYLECGRYRGDGRYREHDCQDFATTCLQNESADYANQDEFDNVQSRMQLEQVVLGAPKDRRNPDFELQSQCAPSGARQHTMAQMTAKFTDSCADVTKEVMARAQGTDGWTDPHNEGTYTLLETNNNYVKIKRRTGNNKYTDVLTFDLTADGTGCSANICSVSQGNSNNDAGTNMCNMENLICPSSTENPDDDVACKSLTKDLSYDVSYLECGRYTNGNNYREHDCQDFATTCLKNPSKRSEGFKILRNIFAQ